MAACLDGLPECAAVSRDMDVSRTSRRMKASRAGRLFLSPSVMRLALIALWTVAIATAQSTDSKIVFGAPDVSAPSLLRSIADDLRSRNFTGCPEHVCEKEGRQPRKKEDWKDLGCYCDDVCGMFGDCCADASRAAEKPRTDVKCTPLRNYVGVYVVSLCPAEWPQDATRRECEGHSSSDLQAHVLVTNRRTGMTYRNLACAVCHSDTGEAVSWQARLECPTVPRGSRVRLKQLETGGWVVTRQENGTEVSDACQLNPYMPETVTDVVRTCEPLVDSCPSSWTDQRVADLCDAYTAKVFDIAIRDAKENQDKLTFRNPHCAICNGMVDENIICTVAVGSRFGRHRDFNLQAFSILLDVGEETGSNTVGAKTVCDEGEHWDEKFIKCRALSCDEGLMLKGNECVPIPGPKDFSGDDGRIVFPDGNGKDNENDKDGRVDENEITDFQRCPKIYLSADEFVDRGDGTVVVEQYHRSYGPGEFEIREGELAICSVTSNFRKFDDALTVISLVFLAASIFCLCCHLVVFCLVPDLRNLSGKNLASLCVCLLLGYICFVASPFETSGTGGCRALGIIMYAAFIASFFWMNVMAFDVFITLRQATTELRISSGHRRKRYLLYLLYVCAVTTALVAAAVGTDSSAAESDPFRPAFGERVCWFSRRRALMVFFAAPLILVMAANVAFFLGSASIIGRTTQATASMSCAPSKTNLRLYSRLAVITGLSWLVGLVAGWLDFQPLWYAFVILNTLQGVFIFVFFTLADRVRERIRRDLSRYSRYQARGKLDEVAGSDPGVPCTDSTALQLTDSRPCA